MHKKEPDSGSAESKLFTVSLAKCNLQVPALSHLNNINPALNAELNLSVFSHTWSGKWVRNLLAQSQFSLAPVQTVLCVSGSQIITKSNGNCHV